MSGSKKNSLSASNSSKTEGEKGVGWGWRWVEGKGVGGWRVEGRYSEGGDERKVG